MPQLAFSYSLWKTRLAHSKIHIHTCFSIITSNSICKTLPYLIAHLSLETSPSSSDNPLKLTVPSNLPNLSVACAKITKQIVSGRVKETWSMFIVFLSICRGPVVNALVFGHGGSKLELTMWFFSFKVEVEFVKIIKWYTNVNIFKTLSRVRVNQFKQSDCYSQHTTLHNFCYIERYFIEDTEKVHAFMVEMKGWQHK